MQSFYDYKKFAILYVDDEEKSLKYFQRAFGNKFRILTASDADKGLQLFDAHRDNVGILMTDQRMPGEKGVQFLERVRQWKPEVIRILVTAYTEADVAIDAVNTGAIYKYVSKPWDIPELEITLKRAMEFFIIQKERDTLLAEKLSALEQVVIVDRILGLAMLASEIRLRLRGTWQALQAFLNAAPVKKVLEETELGNRRSPDRWREVYEHVKDHVNRIAVLAKDLDGEGVKTPGDSQGGWLVSDSAPAHATTWSRIRLGDEIDRALQAHTQLVADRQATVHNQVSRGLPELEVDLPRFQRLWNLLVTSVLQSVSAGATIEFSAKSLEGTSRAVPTVTAQIECSQPLAADNRNRLRSVFDPFVPCDECDREVGLNLLACYFLIHHHGGHMDLGSGNTLQGHITLTLPIEASSAGGSEEQGAFIASLLNETLWEKLTSTWE